MSIRETYTPGAAYGAHVEKLGETWTLVLVRTLRHSPEKVWEGLTDPAQLSEWAPYDADRNLSATGPAKLSTVGAPQPHITEGTVKRADTARVLEFDWGGNDMRWELAPSGKGTRLTLWHNINRKFIAMGAAGWHIAFDVLDNFLDGHPIGRMAGPAAMGNAGWWRLHAEYIKQFADDAGETLSSSENQ